MINDWITSFSMMADADGGEHRDRGPGVADAAAVLLVPIAMVQS